MNFSHLFKNKLIKSAMPQKKDFPKLEYADEEEYDSDNLVAPHTQPALNNSWMSGPKVTVNKSELEQYKEDVSNTENSLPGNPASWVTNEPLWNKAKRASEHAFDEVRWPFVTWWYLSHGGKKK